MDNSTLVQNTRQNILLIDDIDSLVEIAKLAYQRSKDIKNFEANKVDWVKNLFVKMKLEYQEKKPFGNTGRIVKVNPKRLKVDFGNYGIWNVPKSMLEITELVLEKTK